MKKNYIIPNTETAAMQAGFICQAASPTSGFNIGGGTLGGGGEVPGSSPIDPM
jgi:hypothetical protein